MVRTNAGWQKPCISEAPFVVDGQFLGQHFNIVSHNVSTGEHPSSENMNHKMLHDLKASGMTSKKKIPILEHLILLGCEPQQNPHKYLKTA